MWFFVKLCDFDLMNCHLTLIYGVLFSSLWINVLLCA